MQPLSESLFTHYANNSSLVGGRPGACLNGSRNLLFLSDGRAQCAKGPALIGGVNGSRILFNAIDQSYAGLGDATTAGTGNVIGLIARALGFIGSGPLYISGASRSVSASTALQLLLYVSSSYSGGSTGPFTAGLSQPTAPTLAVTPTASTVMAGTYSTVHWFVRSVTGGRSRRSSPSAAVVNSGFTLRHTVAGADLTTASTNGYDRIGIGRTMAGFGATGPHYEETEIAISSLTTVDGVANSYEINSADGALSGKDLAPILDFPPPAGVFAAALEDVIAVIGCYGDTASGVSATSPGTAVAVSLPVFVESFPPDNLLFLPAPPKGVLGRAADGFVFIGGEGYVAALLYTGGKNPLSLRVLWPTTGIASANGWFLGEGGRLYTATGKRGLVRIGEDGQPETEWAKDISDDTASWTMANVVGGFDADHNRDVFGHGTMLYPFNPQAHASTGHGWDTPIDISSKITGTLCACVPVSGGLLLAATDGATIRLYTFNSGTGMTYTAIGQIHVSQAEQDMIFNMQIGVRSDTTNSVTSKIFINGEGSTASDTRTLTPVANKAQHLVTQRPNVRGARSHQISLSQSCSTGDAGPDFVRLSGERSNVI